MFSGFFYLDYLSCILSVKEKREILGCGFDRVGKLIEVFFLEGMVDEACSHWFVFEICQSSVVLFLIWHIRW